MRLKWWSTVNSNLNSKYFMAFIKTLANKYMIKLSIFFQVLKFKQNMYYTYMLIFNICFFKNLCGLTGQLLIPIVLSKNALKITKTCLFYYYKLSVVIIGCIISTYQILVYQIKLQCNTGTWSSSSARFMHKWFFNYNTTKYN